MASQSATPTLNSVPSRERACLGAASTSEGVRLGGRLNVEGAPSNESFALMNHRVLWVSSLLALVAACGGRSTQGLDDEASDEQTDVHGTAGTGGTQGSGGSGGGQGSAGSGSSQGIAGSGGAQGVAGSGGGQGTAGAGGTAGTTPTGEGQPCVSEADCTGLEASFCDIFVSQTCLVRGCSVSPDSCSAGKECCDLTAFGLPTLCIAAGACAN